MDKELISFLKDTIINAGEIALKLRDQGLNIEYKEDGSPVTNADKEVSNYIFSKISLLPKKFPVICEEKPIVDLGNNNYFWLIDPIDGTRGFIKNKDSFTVNIALIKDKKPYIGLIYNPPLRKLYYTDHQLNYCMEQDGNLPAISLVQREHDIALVGASHFNNKTAKFLKALNLSEIMTISSSIKLCMIAEGAGDVYPNFRSSMEWDIAAGHAIVNAAGGKLTDVEGKELSYGKASFTSPHFMAYSKRWVNKRS